MAAKLLLSAEGRKTLGGSIFKAGKGGVRGVAGSVVGYTEEGVWFQDRRLLALGEMVLIKWNFVDAILSDAPVPEKLRAPAVGFHAGTLE